MVSLSWHHVERRLGAPLYGPMNAFQQAFLKYANVEDLGSGRLTGRTSTDTSSSGVVADWSCTIQIPQEHAEKLL